MNIVQRIFNQDILNNGFLVDDRHDYECYAINYYDDHWMGGVEYKGKVIASICVKGPTPTSIKVCKWYGESGTHVLDSNNICDIFDDVVQYYEQLGQQESSDL